MTDDGVREIQLNGKQLVFLFMSATVVAVVIFLCGVMVGRGVRVQQVEVPDAEAVAQIDPTASPTIEGPALGDGAPLTTQETLTYADRLGRREPPAETLRDPAPAPPPAAQEIAEPPAEREPVTASANTTATRTSQEPGGSGFVVQVAAVTARGEADIIARRLTTKGYPAFVTSPPGGPARVFRVRVGKYKERQEAESVASRLEREEQFKPWITR